MEILEGSTYWSASDLVSYTKCERLPWLNQLDARGIVHSPGRETRRYRAPSLWGSELEQSWTSLLEERAGQRAIVIPWQRRGLSGWRAAVAETLAAIQRREPIIYQAHVMDESQKCRGRLDYLLLEGDRYVVADAKGSQVVTDATATQLAFYADLLTPVLGYRPEARVLHSDLTSHTVDLDRIWTTYQQARGSLVLTLESEVEPDPMPVEHCRRCDWEQWCHQTRVAVDHLSLIAGISRREVVYLRAAGVRTAQQLVNQQDSLVLRDIEPRRLTWLSAQADVQLRARELGQQTWSWAPGADAAQLVASLPPASNHDLFLRLGQWTDGERPSVFAAALIEAGHAGSITQFRARTVGEQRQLGAAVLDSIANARSADPNAHVFVFRTHDLEALQQVVARSATRQRQLDQFIEEGVFVDLHRVATSTVLISDSKTSLHAFERQFGHRRSADPINNSDIQRLATQAVKKHDAQSWNALQRQLLLDCRAISEVRSWLFECALPELDLVGDYVNAHSRTETVATPARASNSFAAGLVRVQSIHAQVGRTGNDRDQSLGALELVS
jgi:uncharacterized protein